MPRHDRPYTIAAAHPKKSEYTLSLPNNPKTFPGFHASLLKRFIPNNAELFPSREFSQPPPILTEEGMEENMIEKIQKIPWCFLWKQYLVRWVGYGKDQDQWMSGKELEKNEALDIWERENGTKI
ncbi:hypothetical protein M422DRAFT_176903 [Sphaerobolus stellatus SS14]|uniref:Chromo domain-containing protein n=1 Tax=Sphaerobolus stellatus (strain SS14) TaxID=990650 RepID=A0A0C9V9M8_SPHS4|nr:hypothetical protein M422DRAFT_176903 [Sphaerobolus stellatus SS14]